MADEVVVLSMFAAACVGFFLAGLMAGYEYQRLNFGKLD